MSDTRQTPSAVADSGDDLFLPSFCEVRLVFTVVIIAELLAFILVLAPLGGPASRWGDLALVSLFIQWIALSSAAALCLARPALRRVPNIAAGVLAYLLLLLVAVIISELAWQAMQGLPGMVGTADHRHAGFLLRNLAISAVISAMALRYLYVKHQWQQQIEAEAMSREQALQARIRPHFLFNSLNTIAALIRSRPEQAEEAVQDLADLFRASLGGRRSEVFFAEELEITRRYLHMESLRLGERLQLHWDLDAVPADFPVPPLVLQPIVENAIYHGIEQRAGGGVVEIRGRQEKDRVVLTVSNPLQPAAAHGRHDGNRLAVDNIRQRLQLAYGPGDWLDVEEGPETYTVSLRFPQARVR